MDFYKMVYLSKSFTMTLPQKTYISTENLPDPDMIANEIKESLKVTQNEINSLLTTLSEK